MRRAALIALLALAGCGSAESVGPMYCLCREQLSATNWLEWQCPCNSADHARYGVPR
ncbi:MAG: hypothetical protein KA761_00395 [Gemmatimonadaceae bacterium]|nr:hypothetical protein [Gemmatimonadaceae bacterium]